MPGNPEIYAQSDARAYTKQAEHAALTLFFVALRHGWSADRMRTVLADPAMRMAPAAAAELCTTFAQHRDVLRVQAAVCGGSGHALPHLSDVEWKLTCAVRSSQLSAELLGSSESGGDDDALQYTISLGRAQANSGAGEHEPIATFQCNVEELQALVARLKEAERHCERFAREAKS